MTLPFQPWELQIYETAQGRVPRVVKARAPSNPNIMTPDGNTASLPRTAYRDNDQQAGKDL